MCVLEREREFVCVCVCVGGWVGLVGVVGVRAFAYVWVGGWVGGWVVV